MHTHTNKHIICLIPVYNDWESLVVLLNHLESALKNISFSILVVNDDSSIAHILHSDSVHVPLTILHMTNNVGHQKAIAIGLSYIDHHIENYDAVVVMDADGEDKPEDIIRLISKAENTPLDKVIFASRRKRSEGMLFILFYFLYKRIFHLLTGQSITFGNYSYIPKTLVKKIISVPELWNHYSGSILKYKIPYDTIHSDRGTRYMGTSKMNFQSLVLHGLNAIAIYMDILSVRLLLLSLGGIILSGIAIFIIFLIRMFTELAIPGWASNISLLIINIIIQFFSITLLILLLQLNNKNSIKPSPKNLFQDFIYSITRIRQ